VSSIDRLSWRLWAWSGALILGALILYRVIDVFALALLLFGALVLAGIILYRSFYRLPLADADIVALRRAVDLLEHPGFAARLTNLLGKPVDLIGEALPSSAKQAIATATTKSLELAFRVALHTIRNEPHESSQLLHKTLAVASGAAGGTLGISSLPLELPVSTIIILRSILDIARSEGENLIDPEAALSCVAVLGLAARPESDDASNSDYFVRRGELEESTAEVARYIAERGIIEEGSPLLVRFIALIASRFGFLVSEKVAAQTIPVISALGGAAINYAFIDHLQSVARGHFTVRRLERKYGKNIVFTSYQELLQDLDWN
jgi:EcsC protein family